MVIIQLMEEALGEYLRNPELLRVHVIILIRTVSLQGEFDLIWYNVAALTQGWSTKVQVCSPPEGQNRQGLVSLCLEFHSKPLC